MVNARPLWDGLCFAVSQKGREELATVQLRDGESQEQLLKRFRKKVQNARILSTHKKHRFFMSNAEKRRLALRKAQRRQRRRTQRNQRSRRR
jgi:small subunit ribosomal protein S21